ncbi:MAG: hypothetical protein SVX43_14380 [Cyanobacteriota bacterium]|nr:hypothetical protein [Cyanobacteriota bacterium]
MRYAALTHPTGWTAGGAGGANLTRSRHRGIGFLMAQEVFYSGSHTHEVQIDPP